MEARRRVRSRGRGRPAPRRAATQLEGGLHPRALLTGPPVPAPWSLNDVALTRIIEVGVSARLDRTTRGQGGRVPAARPEHQSKVVAGERDPKNGDRDQSDEHDQRKPWTGAD